MSEAKLKIYIDCKNLIASLKIQLRSAILNDFAKLRLQLVSFMFISSLLAIGVIFVQGTEYVKATSVVLDAIEDLPLSQITSDYLSVRLDEGAYDKAILLIEWYTKNPLNINNAISPIASDYRFAISLLLLFIIAVAFICWIIENAMYNDLREMNPKIISIKGYDDGLSGTKFVDESASIDNIGSSFLLATLLASVLILFTNFNIFAIEDVRSVIFFTEVFLKVFVAILSIILIAFLSSWMNMNGQKLDHSIFTIAMRCSFTHRDVYDSLLSDIAYNTNISDRIEAEILNSKDMLAQLNNMLSFEPEFKIRNDHIRLVFHKMRESNKDFLSVYELKANNEQMIDAVFRENEIK